MALSRIRTFSAGVGILALGIAVGFELKRAYADGIPTPNPLYYSGFLSDNGVPVAGMTAMTIKLWAAEAGGATALCTTDATPDVKQGRFRIALASDCKKAVNDNPNTWVEVIVGQKSLGMRAPIGAVPYAVEADHAVTAASATNAATASAASGTLAQLVVPSGAVMAFDLHACPPDWTAFAAALGRTVIGTNPGGNGLAARSRGDKLGEETHALSVAEMAPHTHTSTVYGMTGAFVNNQTGLRINGGSMVGTTFGESIPSTSTGNGTPFTNFQPSLALLYCKKE